MTVTVRSFAKINLGLYIGSLRADGYHDLRTVYQTIALHDVIRVSVARGTGIEIFCADPRVPCDASNTCYRVAERVMEELGAGGRVTIEIEKRLPVQGGLGAGSSNAVATMIGLERALKKRLSQPAPVALPPTMGTVQVRSTPYLSEVFVDGDSMGYTPAKVSLPPGKHAFRVEKAGYKAWTKEIVITVGSELTLDASLEKK